MTVKRTPQAPPPPMVPVGEGAMLKQLQRTGRLPPVSLQVTPLSGAQPFPLTRFLSYQFSSSILVPVDSFSFNFVAPDDPNPFDQSVKEGDIVTLLANGIPLCTGLLDVTDVETDTGFGEKIMVSGRDLIGQLEDQDAVSLESEILIGQNFTVSSAIRTLIRHTRVPGFNLKGFTPSKPYLLATEPGESKLTALQRFCEPLNILFWAAPNGRINIGKPDMKQAPRGTIICSKAQRRSNVMSIKCSRASATIPNAIIPVWAGQEQVVSRISKEQVIYNSARGPKRLRQLGHVLSKATPISNPQGASAQELSDVNRLTANAGASNLIQAYAKREFARQNHKELIVQAVVLGHFNESGEPWQTDTVYRVNYDRGNVDENMYLFQVEYSMDESTGQRTTLSFCRLGTIVADVEAP